MENVLKRWREWQKRNPDWELYCDLEDTEKYFTQWQELPQKERMYWVGTYGREAREAFEEFGVKRPKVEVGVLDCNMQMHTIKNWPNGPAMTVYRTKIDGVAAIS